MGAFRLLQSLKQQQRRRSACVEPCCNKISELPPCDDQEPANDQWTCAICFERMVDPAIGGFCAHHFCHDCLLTWASASGASCPCCRAPILRVIRDPEFAQTIPEDALSTKTKARRTLPPLQQKPVATEGHATRTVPVAWPPGITLALAPSHFSPLPQVVVVDVVEDNGAERAGIRAGDIVISVNGASVAHERVAVQLIDRYATLGMLELEVVPSIGPPPPAWAYLRSAYEDQRGLHSSSYDDIRALDDDEDELPTSHAGRSMSPLSLPRMNTDGTLSPAPPPRAVRPAPPGAAFRPRSPRRQHRERAFVTVGHRREARTLQQVERRLREVARGAAAHGAAVPHNAIVHTEDDEGTTLYLLPHLAHRYLPAFDDVEEPPSEELRRARGVLTVQQILADEHADVAAWVERDSRA